MANSGPGRVDRVAGACFVGDVTEPIFLARSADTDRARAPPDHRRALSLGPAPGLPWRRRQRSLWGDRAGFVVGVGAPGGGGGGAGAPPASPRANSPPMHERPPAE